MADNFNTLDRHAGNTWTPTVAGGSTAGTYTLGSVTAEWVRNGSLVWVSAGFTVTVGGAGTGDLVIGGFPYAKAADLIFAAPVYTSGVDLPAGTVTLTIQPTASSAVSTFRIMATLDDGAGTPVPVTGLATGDIIRFAFSYVTDE